MFEKDKPLLKLTTDVVFKMYFCDTKNTELLASFLTAVLGIEDDSISELEILNPTLNKSDIKDRNFIVDVRIKTKTGEEIIVEMQVKGHPYFNERIAVSNARSFSTQLKIGDDYINLKRVKSIVVAGFIVFENEPNYHNIFEYRNEKGLKLTDFQQIHFLEILKVPDIATSKKELWLKLFRINREEEAIMLAEKFPAMKPAVVRLRELSADELAKQWAYEREEGERIIRTSLRAARDEGRIEGKIEGKIDSVFTLIKNGMDFENIVKILKLSDYEIDLLNKRMTSTE